MNARQNPFFPDRLVSKNQTPVSFKVKPWHAIALVVFSILSSGEAVGAPHAIEWGVNVHGGGSNPQNLANKLAPRNLKFVRMDLYGNDSLYLTKFRNTVEILKTKNIKAQAAVYTIFSNGQSRMQDSSADLAEVEQTAYNETKPQIEKTKDLMQDYELQNEVSLYPNIKVPGSSGQKASDYDVPCGRLQAAVLRGMSKAIVEVRKSSHLPLRIILGTTDRSFGFLSYMQQHGVVFDVIGYHIYPKENHDPLDQDPWFGAGGPLGQLAKFNKPIHINEFNCGEIYLGDAENPGPDYENQPGKPLTEAGFRCLDKHLKEIVHQTAANIEAVYFYEIWDETKKKSPENRFGLFYDNSLLHPKISLFIATSFAGGDLSPAEKDELIKRGLGCN